MTLLRGNGKVGVTGGVFSRLEAQSRQADTAKSPHEKAMESTAKSGNAVQLVEREQLVERRFGDMANHSRAKLDRVQLKVQSLYSQTATRSRKRKHVDEDGLSADEPAPITITFFGTDVFSGLKQLALEHPGLVDLNKLPGHLTGESGTSMMSL